MIPLDVTDDESAARAVAAVTEEAGHLDVLVNNAGFGIAGSIEDTSLEEVYSQFEVNFFGVVRMTRAVLPYMRSRGRGLIVNISSIGGLISLPFQGAYAASKFAVEGFTEALRMEASPLGIHAVLIEPADFHTGFTAARRMAAASGEGSAYSREFRNALQVIEADELHGSDPQIVGPLIARVIDTRRPRLRYMVGSPSERLAAMLKRLLPGSLFFPIIESHYRVGR